MPSDTTDANQLGPQVVADVVRGADGWRARTIYWPASGNAQVIVCPLADSSEALAMQRARALALLRYPSSQTLH